MATGVHRTTSSTKLGKRMVQAKGAVLVGSTESKLTPKQREWNRQVEEKKRKTK